MPFLSTHANVLNAHRLSSRIFYFQSIWFGIFSRSCEYQSQYTECNWNHIKLNPLLLTRVIKKFDAQTGSQVIPFRKDRKYISQTLSLEMFILSSTAALYFSSGTSYFSWAMDGQVRWHSAFYCWFLARWSCGLPTSRFQFEDIIQHIRSCFTTEGVLLPGILHEYSTILIYFFL